MAKTYKVRILRNTKVGTKFVRVGEIVDVDEIEFNTLTHFGKAKLVESAGKGPVVDERETELKARLTTRGKVPKPAAPIFDNGGDDEAA